MPFEHAAMRASIVAALVFATPALAQHAGATGPKPSKAEGDARTIISLSEPMRQHMLANMRDHLRSLQEITAALSTGAYDKAADIAESRLGLTSLDAHGAAHLGPTFRKRCRRSVRRCTAPRAASRSRRRMRRWAMICALR